MEGKNLEFVLNIILPQNPEIVKLDKLWCAKLHISLLLWIPYQLDFWAKIILPGVKKVKGNFIIIQMSINQENTIIFDVFKGHVPIPIILVGSHQQSHLLEVGIGAVLAKQET